MSLAQTKGRMIAGLPNKWKTITGNHTVEYSESLIVKSNIEVTITLPPVPSDGQWVKIVDGSGNASIAPIVIDGGTVNIVGQRSSGSPVHIIDVDNQAVMLVYDGTNWVMSPNIAVSQQEIQETATSTAITYAIALG